MKFFTIPNPNDSNKRMLSPVDKYFFVNPSSNFDKLC